MQTSIALEVFEKGLTKSDIKVMASNVVENVLEKGSILQVAEALSAMELFIKDVKADEKFKEYTREETSKFPKGFISASGAKIELTETGTKYDFSQCNDPEYLDKLLILEDATRDVKLSQDFLKTVPSEGIDVRRGDEMVTIFPPSKTSTSSYKITLAK